MNAINVGVGFNPPVTGSEFMLWYGDVTVGGANVSLSTLILPVGFPPQTGFEVALSGLLPGPPPLNVPHFVQTLNGTALITVPAPPVCAALLAGAVAARRRRK